MPCIIHIATRKYQEIYRKSTHIYSRKSCQLICNKYMCIRRLQHSKLEATDKQTFLSKKCIYFFISRMLVSADLLLKSVCNYFNIIWVAQQAQRVRKKFIGLHFREQIIKLWFCNVFVFYFRIYWNYCVAKLFWYRWKKNPIFSLIVLFIE